MRWVHPGPTAPIVVDKYLLPHEHQVITIRLHPAVLTPRAAAATGALLVTVTMSAVVHGKELPQHIAWVLTAFLFVELILAVVNWWGGYVVMTSHRILISSGVSGRRVTSTPLTTITDVSIGQSFAGRLFGYGSLIVKGRSFINYVPYPDQFYLELLALIFPSRDPAEDW